MMPFKCLRLSGLAILLISSALIAEEPKNPLANTDYKSRTVKKLREKLIEDNGGDLKTEAAVAQGLLWLAKQQSPVNGNCQFDGSEKGNRVAATGMALLPFLAAGQTLNDSKYKRSVTAGLNYLITVQTEKGTWDVQTMYSHAIATIALCEAAGMTGDQKIKKAAANAAQYIVEAQCADGSWNYVIGGNGDTSILGWQIQALRSARYAQIKVPQATFDKANKFLDSVTETGATYGYRSKGSLSSLTSVGLLSRLYMGWKPDNKSVLEGAAYLWKKAPPSDKLWDMYYYYYATQVFFQIDGPEWQKNWNPAMKEVLLKRQITDKTRDAKPADIGSFPKDDSQVGEHCGRLGTTALALATLEVYYRHGRLFQRKADLDLEK